MQWTTDVTKALGLAKERGDKKALKSLKKKQVITWHASNARTKFIKEINNFLLPVLILILFIYYHPVAPAYLIWAYYAHGRQLRC